MHHPFPFRRALLLPALCVAGLAFAQPAYVDIEARLTPEQLHATGLDTLAPTQLSELNRILRGEAADAVSANAVPPRAAGGAGDGSSLLGFTDQPIRAHLVGSVSEWAPGTVFVLDNGQQWKVLKGSMKLRKPLDAPAVVLVPGLAGRWFLRVDEDLPAPRVYRID